MLKNYLKIVIRNVLKNKVYSFVNIMGLTLGMTICIFSLIFIRYELNFDTYHKNADSIYRVTSEYSNPQGYHSHFARCPAAWINNLPDDFPEVKSLIRFQWTPSVNLRIGNNLLRSFKWFYTDSNIFDVFNFTMLEGNASTALKNPHSVVLTKEMSRKFFGRGTPIGKEISLFDDNSGQFTPFKVTGVIDDLPPNSHFQIEFLASYPSSEARRGWAWVYLLLKPGTNVASLEKKFPGFIKKYAGDEVAQTNILHLQALKDIHLYSNLDREIEPNGDIQYIYIFSAVAFLVILIACFNFMNLSTARSIKRAKEVGVRKVLGADRKQLFNYFLWESILFSMTAFLIAILIVITVFPLFNSLLGIPISLESIFYLPMLIAFFLIALITGILAGIYPSLVLSSFAPITALSKGINVIKSKSPLNLSLRRTLVVMQFTVSTVLIIFTLFSYKQFSYINNKKLGFNKDQVIAITNVSRNDQLKYPVFKNELKNHSGIVGVTACMDVPSSDILDAGFTQVEGIHTGDEATVLSIQSVDSNFINVMGLELVAGKNFDDNESRPGLQKPMNLSELQQYLGRKKFSFILNESAIKRLGLHSPGESLNKELEWANVAFRLSGKIVGVVKDYNYASLRLKIRPLILVNVNEWQGNFLVKVSPKNITSTMNNIEKAWKEVYPDSPLQYEFLDDLFGKLYRSEERQGQLLSIFSALAIFIAYLGLFGLVAYTTEQRTKEIGIRKVMGASIPGIVYLLLKEFTRLILLANLFAVPIGLYLVTKWLENFAYRINANVGVFILAGGLSILIAFITVYRQTIHAATSNPVEALRYE